VSVRFLVEDWVAIATVIEKHYWDYQGFLIIHGTDTMSVRQRLFLHPGQVGWTLRHVCSLPT
jgi:hypothetical protein